MDFFLFCFLCMCVLIGLIQLNLPVFSKKRMQIDKVTIPCIIQIRSDRVK